MVLWWMAVSYLVFCFFEHADCFSECQNCRNATDLNLPAGTSECQVYLAQWNWTTKDYRKVFLGNLAPPFRIVWSPHCFQAIPWLQIVTFTMETPLSRCQKTTSSDLAIIGLSSVSDTYCSLKDLSLTIYTVNSFSPYSQLGWSQYSVHHRGSSKGSVNSW